MKEYALGIITKILGFYMNMMSLQVKEIMKFGSNTTLLAVVYSVMDVVGVIGFSLIIVYTVESLIDQFLTLGRELSYMSYIKAGAGMILSYFIFRKLPKLCGLIFGFNDGFIEEVNNIQIDNSAYEGTEIEAFTTNWETTIVEPLKSLSTPLLFLIVVMVFIMAIIGIGAACLIIVKCLTAKLEFLLRVCFSPIGLSGLASGSHRQQGLKYLKKLFGAALYSGSIILIVNLSTLMTLLAYTSSLGHLETGGASFTNILGSFLALVAAPFASVGAIGAVKSVINEAVS